MTAILRTFHAVLVQFLICCIHVLRLVYIVYVLYGSQHLNAPASALNNPVDVYQDAQHVQTIHSQVSEGPFVPGSLILSRMSL